MLKRPSKVRIPDPDPVTRRGFDESLSILRQLFARLHVQFSEPVGLVVATSPSSEPWQDDSYCYFEIDVSKLAVSELDISVTNGRAYIRVGR